MPYRQLSKLEVTRYMMWHSCGEDTMRRIQCSVVDMGNTKETSQLKSNYTNDAPPEGSFVWTSVISV